MKVKRSQSFLSVFLSLVLVVGLCPASALADEPRVMTLQSQEDATEAQATSEAESEVAAEGNDAAADASLSGQDAVELKTVGPKGGEVDPQAEAAYAILTADGALTFQLGGPTAEQERIGVAYWWTNLSSSENFANFLLDEYTRESLAPWLNDEVSRNLIRSVVFKDSLRPAYLSYWFLNCENLVTVDFSGLDAGSCKSFAHLFEGCKQLGTMTGSGMDAAPAIIDFTPISTSTALTNMAGMFKGCTGLEEVTGFGDLTTSQVTDMSSLFEECTNLVSVDTGNLNTGNARTMANMFKHCYKLAEPAVSGFITTNVTDMSGMFEGCSSSYVGESAGGHGDDDEEGVFIDVSGFNTSKVTTMANMFNGCVTLTLLDLSGFDTVSANTTVTNMLANCSSIETLMLGEKTRLSTDANLPNIDASGTGYTGLWSGTPVVVENGVERNWEGTSDQLMLASNNDSASMAGTFRWQSGLTDPYYALLYNDGELYFQLGDQSNNAHVRAGKTVVGAYTGFVEAYYSDVDGNRPPWYNQRAKITTVADDTSMAGRTLSSTAYWFKGCTNLESVSFHALDTTRVTDMSHMFDGCGKLLTLDISSFDVKNNTITFGTTQQESMFAGTTKLRTLVLGEYWLFEMNCGLSDPAYGTWKNAGISYSGNSQTLIQEYNRTGMDTENPTNWAGTYEWTDGDPIDISTYTSILGLNSAYNYTGKAINPTITVVHNGAKLTANVDYTVSSWKNNVNVGTATATVYGIGSYSGSRQISFTINKASLAGTTIGSIATYTYTGKAFTPKPVVKFNGTTLAQNTDYTVSYKNNTGSATGTTTATVTITGKGNFTGTKSATFKILPKPTLSGASQIYVGSKALYTVKNGSIAIKSGGSYATLSNNTLTGKKAGTVVLSLRDSQGREYGTKSVKVVTMPSVCYIQSSLNSKMVLDVEGASTANGGNVLLWTKNNGSNQKFRLQLQSDGSFYIRSAKSGKLLDISSSSTKNGGNVVQWQAKSGSNKSQRWQITVDANNKLTFVNLNSLKALDINGSKAIAGKNVCQQTSSGKGSQKWTLASVSVAIGSVYEGTYRIAPASNTKLALDISGASKKAGANAIVWTSKSSSNQKFKLVYVGNGLYRIVASHSNMALDVSGAAWKNGANVLQWTTKLKANDNQLWKPVRNSDGTYTFYRNGNKKWALAVSSAKNGGNVYQASAKAGAATQKFRLYQY